MTFPNKQELQQFNCLYDMGFNGFLKIYKIYELYFFLAHDLTLLANNHLRFRKGTRRTNCG